MRIIITGGTGLIGRPLADKLAASGHEVIVLSRNPGKATNLPSTVRAVHWDASSAAGWGHLVDGDSAIVNLAGENLAGAGFFPQRWTSERKQRIVGSRLNAGRAVVQAVETATHPPRVVIQSSGIGFYGPCGDEEIHESSPAGDDWLAQTAIQWEASTAPVEAMGVRRVIIRTAGVFANAGGVLPRVLLPFRLFLGGPVGGGRQWVPWIHITDAIRAIHFLIEHETAIGPFNLVAPHALTNREFGQTIARVLKRPALLPIPALILRLAFGEMATLLLDGQRGVPKRLLELGFTFHFSEAEPALRDLLGRS